MLPSRFSWLDHPESDHRIALDVVEMFRENDTRDELGIETFRDVISDMLFSGFSTIQTRTKHFLFIPSFLPGKDGRPMVLQQTLQRRAINHLTIDTLTDDRRFHPIIDEICFGAPPNASIALM